jgi:menaquinone-specific isochorismate synthase
VSASKDLQLAVVSTPLSHAPAFTEILDAGHPLLWRRRGAGLVGYGITARLEFTGPDRVADAAAEWQHIVSNATIDDQVNLPGSGLSAFGTFAFADDSSATSVLVIPELIIGRRDGVAFVTTISHTGHNARAAEIPQVSPLGEKAAVSFRPGEQSETGYRESVREAVRRIQQGQVSKVVLARDLVGTIADGEDIRPMVIDLAQSYPDCWTYCVDGLIGSSPETLVRVHDTTMDARVLAGTAARGIDAHTDLEAAAVLATSSKDLDEHAFAVRSVIDSLGPFTTHLSTGDSPFTLRLANLWHLATDVTGNLTPGSTSLDLVAALHPTAAVAGTPTAAALRVISELEPFDRGRYSGAVGWVGSSGEGEWAIALRCVQIEGQRVTAYAGCGVVANSDAEAELSETKMKFRPVVDALLPVE